MRKQRATNSMAESRTNYLAYFRPQRDKKGQIVLVFDAPTKLDKFLAHNIGKKMYADIHRETGVRSPQQNKAIHVGFTLIAEALNDAGLDMRAVLKPGVSIPWTKDSVKEHLWRPIQKLMLLKESTRDLAKIEDIEVVWETMMKHLCENHGIEYIPFPHDKKLTSYQQSEARRPRDGGVE